MPAPAPWAPGLYWFATSPDGDGSTLWRSDVAGGAGEGGALARDRVLRVEHAPGYAPRGTVTADGRHAAWVVQPRDSRHADPARLVVDGEVQDEAALYLQEPVFSGERLYWLRRWPAEPRLDDRGRMLPPLDGFDLLSRGSGPEPDRVVARWDALWVQVCGSLAGTAADPEPGLLVLVIDGGGAELLDVGPGGAARTRHRMAGLDVRDVRPIPGTRQATLLASQPGSREASALRVDLATGEETLLRADLDRDSSPRMLPSGELAVTLGEIGRSWSVPEDVIDGDLLLREHGPGGLDWVLARSGGERLLLVPAGDPKRDVSLLGAVL